MFLVLWLIYNSRDGLGYGLGYGFLSYREIGSKDLAFESVHCEHVLHSTM